MIELYSWNTSNGRKASIMLEECGLPYNVHPINIGQDEQFTPHYLTLNPNGKIPAIIDSDGPEGKPYNLFESGAILLYLAEKTGRFMPQDRARHYAVMQWLMWQMGGVGPIFGQLHHFKRAAKDQVPYAIARYDKECRRLYGVLDKRLQNRDYVCDELSIADFAIFPWTARYEWQEIDLAEFPNVKRWFDTLITRPGVQRGMQIPEQ